MSKTMKRIDAVRNMARFYRIDMQPDLFGGVQLVRQWGRIGTKGQGLRQYFEDEAGAQEKLELVVKAKIKKGYLV